MPHLHHTAQRSPVRPVARPAIPTPGDARAARARLRLARREGDAAVIAECLAVMEAHDTGRPVRATTGFGGAR